jgi:hypothetical protein
MSIDNNSQAERVEISYETNLQRAREILADLFDEQKVVRIFESGNIANLMGQLENIDGIPDPEYKKQVIESWYKNNETENE